MPVPTAVSLRLVPARTSFAALTQREARALFERNVVHEVTDKLDIVARHDHGLFGVLRARRVRQRDGHIRGADEQLRAVLHVSKRMKRRTLFMNGV